MKRIPLVLVALAALLLAGGAQARNYNDPVGDAHGAPDLSEVFVNDTSDAYSFTIQTEQVPTARDVIRLGIDYDHSQATGDGSGVDARVDLVGPRPTIHYSQWRNGRFVPSPTYGDVTVERTDITTAVALSREAFRLFTPFRFRVSVLRGGVVKDNAPDTGLWAYAVQATHYLELNGQPLTDGIHAGKRFVVRTDVATSAPEVVPGCTVTIAGKRITTSAVYRGGNIVCTGTAPAGTAGQLFEITFLATADRGATKASRTFSFIVEK